MPATRYWISVRDAAARADVSDQYVRRMIRDGRVEAMRHGNVWLVPVASIEAFLGTRTSNAFASIVAHEQAAGRAAARVNPGPMSVRELRRRAGAR